MRPELGIKNLVSRLKQVVLPAPFGPISAWMLPRLTRRLTLLTATKPLNSFVKFSVSRMYSPAIVSALPRGGAGARSRRHSRRVDVRAQPQRQRARDVQRDAAMPLALVGAEQRLVDADRDAGHRLA